MRIDHCFYHAWIVVAWLGVSCAANPEPVAKQVVPTANAKPAPLWPKLLQASSWPKLEHAVRSGGHSGQPYQAEVRVDPAALPQYQNLVAGSTLPVGTTVVQFHRDQQHQPGPVYVMEKTDIGTWIFSELDATGHVKRSGALPDCARCHAEGVADSLFGPERAPRQ